MIWGYHYFRKHPKVDGLYPPWNEQQMPLKHVRLPTAGQTCQVFLISSSQGPGFKDWHPKPCNHLFVQAGYDEIDLFFFLVTTWMIPRVELMATKSFISIQSLPAASHILRDLHLVYFSPMNCSLFEQWKKGPWLVMFYNIGYIGGWYTTQIYLGTTINHCKDPNQPTSIMECQPVFFSLLNYLSFNVPGGTPRPHVPSFCAPNLAMVGGWQGISFGVHQCTAKFCAYQSKGLKPDFADWIAPNDGDCKRILPKSP